MNHMGKSPYFQLMRLDKPVGFLLLMFPPLWTVTICANTITQFVGYALYFAFGAIIIRSAFCIANDMFDRKLDSKIERTKNRPIASGSVTVKSAILLFILLLSIGFLMLLYLPLPALKVGFVAAVLSLIYPLIKRISYYPQVFLGITFNLGVLIAWFAFETNVTLVPVLLYLSSILWTIGYDTIYAYQDIEGDKKTGIKSLALKLQGEGPKIIWKIYFAVIMLFLTIAVNTFMNMYFYLVFSIACYQMYWQCEALDITSAKDCNQKFQSNILTGLLILLACIIGKV